MTCTQTDRRDTVAGVCLVKAEKNSFQYKHSSKSPRVHSEPLCKGFRTSDPQRNAMGQSTEMSPLDSMLF